MVRQPDVALPLRELEIAPVSEAQLAEYAAVPIRFAVTQRITVGNSAEFAPCELRASPVPVPFEKDYDAVPGMSPIDWPSRYRLRDWRIIAARRNGVVVGGAAFAPGAEVGMDLDGRGDTAVLWDLRVAPSLRGRHIGAALFRAGERWASHRAYGVLLAETQDINVAACRFYRSMGCTLISYDANAYPELPGEARLLWRRDLPVDRLDG
jgi:ribosomal protein S18 acetylase RimI-like enzyme